MKHSGTKLNNIKKLNTVKRKAVCVSSINSVEVSYLDEQKSFPLLIKPVSYQVNLVAWATDNSNFIKSNLLQYGAILFRGFDIRDIKSFEELIKAISGHILEYRYRASPRSLVGNNIYTSTDYPPEHEIFPHNEHAYSPTFPLKIYFYCIKPALEGGETPIGNTRKIFKRIDSKITRRFEEKQIMYIRNFGSGFGLPWQTVFQTTERSVVESYCDKECIEVEWREGDRLRTRQIGPAIIKHPLTGEKVWFNHATFFHVSTLESAVSNALLMEFDEIDLPNNTFYGDGSSIEPFVLNELRKAYMEEMVTFPWKENDVLLLDNMLTVHGRKSFVGSRKVVVGMAEKIDISAQI